MALFVSLLHSWAVQQASTTGQNSSVSQPWELLSLQQPGHSWPQFVKCPLSTWFCISQRVKGTSAALSPLYASLSQTTISNAASMPSLVAPSLYNGSGNCLQVARRGGHGVHFIYLPTLSPELLVPQPMKTVVLYILSSFPVVYSGWVNLVPA